MIQTDLLRGNIFKSILFFAAPMFLSLVFQQLYSMADMVIVGRTLGEQSLAAIGSSAVLFELLIGFAIGIGAGFGIVVARSKGAGDAETLKKAVAGSVIQGILLVAIVSVAASVFLKPILRLLGTPGDIIDQAYSFISVLIAFSVVLFAYNLCAGLMRAVGNSTAPLVFLIISSLLNVGLDILFIVVFKMSVRGVAMATVIAQGISAVLCVIYIFKKCPELVPRREHFRFDAALYKELAGQGLSMGFMMSIVSLGTVALQSAINALDTLVIAGHVVARRLNGFCLMPIVALSMATSTFVSQNKGANQLDRIRKAVRYSNLFALGWCVCISMVLMFAAPALMRLISGSGEDVVIRNGTLYLRITSPFYMVLGPLFSFRYSLQGIGRKVVPLISSVMELIGKILFAFWLVPKFGYIGVIFCEPIIWCFMCLQLMITFYRDPYIRGEEP